MRKSVAYLVMVCSIFVSAQASAQVLFTGKTSGDNNGSVYLFGTTASVDDVTSSNNWVGLVLGVTDRVDVVAGWGDMSTLGEHFLYGAVGGVVGLPTEKFGFNSMVYQLFSVPHSNRGNSSSFFGNSVLIVSKDFTVGDYTFTPYTGYNGNYAFGPKERIMTFSEPTHQLPLGIFLPVTRSWGLTAEYDYGQVQSFGISLNLSFKYR